MATPWRLRFSMAATQVMVLSSMPVILNSSNTWTSNRVEVEPTVLKPESDPIQPVLEFKPRKLGVKPEEES